MKINKRGIESASRDEMLAIWLFDDDLFRLMVFAEWVKWARIVGVKVNG